MCTLSWLADPKDGYTLWFNRDELHSRNAELPPVEHETLAGIKWLAPIDPESGGTWLMVNAVGLTVAVLNDYESTWVGPRDGARESRGRLPGLVAGGSTAKDAVESIAGEELGRTPPFELVAADAAGGVASLHWDGERVHLLYGEGVRFPRSSSSYRPAEVIVSRRRSYPVPATPELIHDFHHIHDADSGAFSVNMSRADASTRSICMVRISREEVRLDYDPQNWPGAPKGTQHQQIFSLRRGTGKKFSDGAGIDQASDRSQTHET